MAAEYGVPQSRERVIFLGFRKSALTDEALTALSQKVIPAEYDPYPVKTHSNQPSGELLPFVTTKQCFLGLQEPEVTSDVSQKKYSKAKYMGKHCQGQTEINLDYIGPTIRSEHHGNIEYRRLSKEHGGNHTDELKKGLKQNYYLTRSEWPYKDVPRKIIAEKYMEDASRDLKDYKFYCFNGEMKFVMINSDRNTSKPTRADYFDRDFNWLDFTWGYSHAEVHPQKPEQFEKMIAIAEKLAKGLPHIRVDFYDCNG